MNDTDERFPRDAADLRKQAEAAATEPVPLSPETSEGLPGEAMPRLLHELQVHQIELEMQNEELRLAQVELDASRQRYFDLYDQAPVGYVTVSEQGLILEANLTAAGMLGVIRGALVKQPLSRFILKEDQDLYYLKRNHLFETGEKEEWDLRMVQKDGTPCWAHMQATIAQDAMGAPICRLVMSDISERKKVEEALEESEFFFRESQRAAAIGSYKTDFIEGKWESSEVLDSIFGIAKSFDRSIQGWFDIVHPDDQPMMNQYLRDEVIAGRKAFSKEYRIIRKGDGVTRWVHGSGELKFDEAGRALSLIGVIQDITESKQAENALNQEKTFNRALLDTQIEGVVACDENGDLVLFNRTLAKWQGMDAFKLPQEQWAEHYDLFEADGTTPLATDAIPLVRAFHGEVIHDVGAVICVKNQPPRHVLCNGSPITDESNRRLGAVVVMHDITRQRENEELLQNTLQRLELATTSASMGVWDWDLQVGTMIWDDRMFELYGASREEIHGTVQDWKNGLHPEDLEQAVAECGAAIRGEAPFDTEFRVKHRNGNILWIKANAVVLRDQDGKPVRMIGMNQDITEQRKVQEQIRHLNRDLEVRVEERTAQLESANKELEAFSYSVSHDLRAPLRSIEGFSEFLLEEYRNQLDDSGKHYLQRIRAGTQRMGDLIADLLKLSKTNRTELTLADCDLSRLSGEIANILTMANQPCRVEITIQSGMLVQADHHLMQVLLENLLGNAWKFTSKTETPRIEVGERVSPGGERTFFIRDNGVGFDMAHADKLFNAFQRLHSTSDFEGTGIGLAIVQRIIQRHGGRVWAEAEVGQGATFFFTIPEWIGH